MQMIVVSIVRITFKCDAVVAVLVFMNMLRNNAKWNNTVAPIRAFKTSWSWFKWLLCLFVRITFKCVAVVAVYFYLRLKYQQTLVSCMTSLIESGNLVQSVPQSLPLWFIHLLMTQLICN